MIGSLLPADLLVLDTDQSFGREGVIGFLGRTVEKAAYSSRSIYKVRWGGRDLALKVEHVLAPVGADPRETGVYFNQSWDELVKWNRIERDHPELVRYFLPTLGYGQVEVARVEYKTGDWTTKGWVDRTEELGDWRCFSIQPWSRLTRRAYDGGDGDAIYQHAWDIARQAGVGDFGAHQFFVRSNGDPVFHDYAIGTCDEED